MTDVQQSSKVEQVEAVSLLTQLQKVPVFAGISLQELRCLESVELIHADAGADLMDITRTRRGFWIVLEGELRLQKRQTDGELMLIGQLGEGETFGELPLLMGKDTEAVVTVLKPSTVVYLQEQLFLESDVCLPPGAYWRFGEHGAQVAGLSVPGAASRKTYLSGHNGRRPDARVEQSGSRCPARSLANAREP